MSGPALGASGGRSGGRWGLIAVAVVLGAVMIGGALMFLKPSGNEPEQPTSSLDRSGAAATNPEHGAAAAKAPGAKEPEATPPGEPVQPEGATGTTRPVAAEEPTVPADGAGTVKPAPKPAVPRTPRPPKPAPAAAPAPVAEAPKHAEPKPSAPAAAPAEAPKKPVQRCDCKPADLLCAMKCSAKKP